MQPDVRSLFAKAHKPWRRKHTRIGTMNIISLTGKCEELVDLMERRKISILGLSETKWKGKGKKELRKNYTLYWHGNDKEMKNGVGLIVSKDLNGLADVQYINERIIKVTVHLGKERLTLVQVYAPQTGCRNEEKTKFLEDLEESISEDKAIIIGDCNAQVGTERTGYEKVMGPHGYGRRNVEGEHLLDFCLRNGLVLKNSWFKKRISHKITRYSWNGQQKTIIDYVITDEEKSNLVTDVKVIPSDNINSDHRLLVADLREIHVSKIVSKKMPKIKVWDLEKPEKRSEYQERIRKQLPKDETRNGEEEWSRLRNTLVNVATEVCGKTSGKVREKETPWWNEKVKAAIKERNAARKERDREKFKSEELQNEMKIRDLEQKFRDKKLAVKRIVVEEKTKCWNKFTEKLEEDSRGNMKLLYRVVKSKRKPMDNIKALEDCNGNMVRNESDIREVLKEHFDVLLNGTEKEQTDVEKYVEYTEQPPITWTETEEALKKMPKGKSPGIDEVSADMIKAAGVQGIQWLHRVLNAVWKENKIPADWSKGIIIPLFKKGNRRKCNNYRGITLLSHGLKILEKIIERRLRNIIEPQLEEEQYGFRPNRSTIDLIFSIRMLMEKYWEKGKDLFMVFMDIEKAYDSVKRVKIWECLRKRKVPEGLLKKIQMLYTDCSSCVRVGGGSSCWFPIKRGVQQGSALSPLLFITIMDDILKSLKETTNKLNAMVFADDVMIWGETEEEVQISLNKWRNKFAEFNLKISNTKSVSMVVSRGCQAPNIMLGDQRLESVDSFMYLGCVVSSDNFVKKEIVNRTQKGSNFYQTVRTLLWDPNVPRKAKVAMFNSYLKPILTYGMETCTLTRSDSSRLQAVEMKFLRSTIQKTKLDKVQNEEVRKEAGIRTSLLDQVSISRLRWFGHIMRMEPTRTARLYLDREVKGKRQVGRPRTRWMDTIKKDVAARGVVLEDILEKRLYMDRSTWKRLTNRTRETGAVN